MLSKVSAPLKIGLMFGELIVWPTKLSFLHTIEMPEITSMQNKHHLILSESILPYPLTLSIKYPQNWASAGYTL